MQNIKRGVGLLLLWSSVALIFGQNKKIVGYYPAWRSFLFPPSELQMNNLTHVIHAFAWPAADGTIQGYNTVPDANLITTVHDAGKKILIAFGGYGNCSGFSTLAVDPEIRTTFINNVVTFIVSNGYDGIDLDWEWPTNNAERDSLTVLVREMREAFDNIDPAYIITMAVPVTNWSAQWLNFSALKSYVTWFNAMTYDFHGSWTPHAGHNAPLYPGTDVDGSVHQGIQYLNGTRGIPKDKLLLGLAFFGKQFAASALYGASGTSGTEKIYSEIFNTIEGGGWTSSWDNTSEVPYSVNDAHTSVLTYDDSSSIAFKCQYAKDNGLSGVMIWALGEDVTPNGQPLMESVGAAMIPPTGVYENQQNNRVQGFSLHQNFPNPFNPSTKLSYTVATAGNVNLKVYNVLGQLVSTIVNNEYKVAGMKYTIEVNMPYMTSGVYFAVLEQANNRSVQKMMLMK